jgi:hypothetical protein
LYQASQMSAVRQIQSFWWIPDQPEKRWFGTLTLGPDQWPELELVIERQSPTDGRFPLGRVIHGKDEHGHPITLLHAGSGGSTVSGAVIKQRVHAGFALLGSNNYPGGNGPEYSRESAFGQFLQALQKLTGVEWIR